MLFLLRVLSDVFSFRQEMGVAKDSTYVSERMLNFGRSLVAQIRWREIGRVLIWVVHIRSVDAYVCFAHEQRELLLEY